MTNSTPLLGDWTLGLDIGANSIGWALVKQGDYSGPEGEPNIYLGSRIFTGGTEGTGTSKEASRCVGRRTARGMRRNIRRRSSRRGRLTSTLRQLGFLTDDEAPRLRELGFYKLDPYEIRAKGVNTLPPSENGSAPRSNAEKLSRIELARAIQHLGQRRGFLSNRRVAAASAEGDKETGVVKAGISEIRAGMKAAGSPTLGHYLATVRTPDSENPAERRKRKLYTERAMFREELRALWQSQAPFHSDLLTEANYELLAEQIILRQRPFDQAEALVGYCSLEPDQRRLRRGHRLAQYFRILQEVDNLRIDLNGTPNDEGKGRKTSAAKKTGKRSAAKGGDTSGGAEADAAMAQSDFMFTDEKKRQRLHRHLADPIIKALQAGDDLSDKQLAQMLGVETHHLTLPRNRRKGLQGNSAEKIMAAIFGLDRYASLTEEQKNDFCHVLLEKEDHELLPIFERDWNLGQAAVDHALAHPIKPIDHGSLSQSAIEKLINGTTVGNEWIEGMAPETDAEGNACGGRALIDVEEDIYGPRATRHAEIEPYDLLPHPPGTFFRRWRNEKKGEKLSPHDQALAARQVLPDSLNQQPIMNPVVKKALYEVRKLVNAIIKRYGLPARITIELARETQGSIEDRTRRISENRKNQDEREQAVKAIEAIYAKVGISARVTGGAILKYRLWRDQQGRCIYSGASISEGQLYTGEVDIDHILPYSLTLDDGYSNKVLCMRTENHTKLDRTPWQAFNHDAVRWDEMIARVKALPWRHRAAKLRRFEMKEIPPMEDFIARKLTDTQYISKQVAQYLIVLYPHMSESHTRQVRVGRGQLTARLRHLWGLDSVLAEIHGRDANEEGEYEKMREDHRHHAIDAVVIALTNEAKLNQIAKWQRQRLEPGNRDSLPAPHSWFRAEVKAAIEACIVSHATNHRQRGSLHNDTYYGLGSERGLVKVRKPLAALTAGMIEEIVDPAVKAAVISFVESKGIDPRDKKQEKLMQKVLAEPDVVKIGSSRAGVRRVRIETKSNSVIPIPRSGGMEKPTWVEPGNNLRIDIYEWDGPKGRETAVVTRTLMEVARSQGKPLSKPHPEAELMYSLYKGDAVEVTQNGETKHYIMQKFSDDQYVFKPHWMATSDYVVGQTMKLSSGWAGKNRRVQPNPELDSTSLGIAERN